MRPDLTSPATFHGQIDVKRGDFTRQGVLHLTESGPEALSRAQLIPLLIPPKTKIRPSLSTEDYTYGQNRLLLQAIARAGGGIFNPPKGTSLFKNLRHSYSKIILWKWLIAAAVICYLFSIAIERWKSQGRE